MWESCNAFALQFSNSGVLKGGGKRACLEAVRVNGAEPPALHGSAWLSKWHHYCRWHLHWRVLRVAVVQFYSTQAKCVKRGWQCVFDRTKRGPELPCDSVMA